ncbi:MAG TPA: malectin domain-containing carbohydrate-binding protein [Candidatus Acidoferrum sp.]|nr:malectin domain-containing carbohydrate-binding protein [Candidatus Acidoferrum sp.]
MNNFFKLVALLAIAVLPVAAQTQQPIRVKCGGPAYTDSKGQLWLADTGFSGGTPSHVADTIAGTSDPALYQTGRYNQSRTTGLAYTFQVPNGQYHVNLYFAETSGDAFYVAGARVFNVQMQGLPVFPGVDVFAEAGAKAALIKGADITVNNGSVNIEFDDVVQNAKVNAIEILPGTSGPQLAMNFKYPDGTAVVGTLHYTVSSPLLSFQGSVPLKNGQADCALFANPSSLGLSMQFTVNVSLNDTAGHLLWDMNLGLNPSQVNFAAVQSSNLTVTVQKQI